MGRKENQNNSLFITESVSSHKHTFMDHLFCMELNSKEFYYQKKKKSKEFIVKLVLRKEWESECLLHLDMKFGFWMELLDITYVKYRRMKEKQSHIKAHDDLCDSVNMTNVWRVMVENSVLFQYLFLWIKLFHIIIQLFWI